MSAYKIPQTTAERKSHLQTTAVEIQKTVVCPACHARAGFYCVTKAGYKSYKYHQKRFDAYIAKYRKETCKDV